MNGIKITGHRLFIWLCLCGLMPAMTQAAPIVLSNDEYLVRVLPDGAVELKAQDTAPQFFAPSFTVLSRADDPKLIYRQAIPSPLPENLAIPNWLVPGSQERTWDLFAAASVTTVSSGKAEPTENGVRWSYPSSSDYDLEARLSLTNNHSEPMIQFRFTPKKDGWYSVGYSGAPELKSADLDELWQPLIWQEKRFPRLPFLSAEPMCPLPATFVTQRGVTIGVAADPEESPFRLPIPASARFGVLLRNAAGNAQPMVFAPVLGGPSSHLKAGQSFEFKVRLMVHAGSAFEAYKHLARSLYGFRDYRENATSSLNETLENMVAFAMDDEYSGWIADLRAFDYNTDVKGTVKVVSALHPLSLALLTDNPEIFRRRALPMIEYLMSRERFLFAKDPEQKGQNASHSMNGPAAPISELAGLFALSRGRSEVFKHYAEALLEKPRVLNLNVVSNAASWQSLLAMYRITGEAKYLERAKTGAGQYLAERVAAPQADFRKLTPGEGFEFWVDYTPNWFDLLEMYEETQEQRYLDGAVSGARLYANYVWLQPRIPQTNVIVNPDGKAFFGTFAPRRIAGSRAIEVPEQSVPAWRVSQIGLTPEASSTYLGNPAIFLTTFAPPFLRLAQATGDDFFRDIARSAVVGRYANFPGYSIKGEYTTVYSRPDFPLRPWIELTYNNIYYNHVWPQIAMVADYLITEAITRSQRRIDFPARYSEGYAYLKGKVYGDRPGKFYDDSDVRLWMPAKLLRADTIQANYVAGYGNGNCYLALMNQSTAPINTRIVLNPDVVPLDETRTYSVRLWRENNGSSTNAGRRARLASRGLRAQGRLRQSLPVL